MNSDDRKCEECGVVGRKMKRVQVGSNGLHCTGGPKIKGLCDECRRPFCISIIRNRYESIGYGMKKRKRA